MTGGGRVLAVPDDSGNWDVRNIGGRPNLDLTRSLKVRLTEKQYSKIESAADAQRIKKVDVIRNLIDEM